MPFSDEAWDSLVKGDTPPPLPESTESSDPGVDYITRKDPAVTWLPFEKGDSPKK